MLGLTGAISCHQDVRASNSLTGLIQAECSAGVNARRNYGERLLFVSGRPIWPFQSCLETFEGHALGCHCIFNGVPQLVGKKCFVNSHRTNRIVRQFTPRALKQRSSTSPAGFRVNRVPNSTRWQIFPRAPNNVEIELNFVVKNEAS